MITLTDWTDKHNTLIFTRAMEPIGWVHCFSKTEWQAFKPDGTFIDWFTSKKAAMAALA
jgi:hypothetical protein